MSQGILAQTAPAPHACPANCHLSVLCHDHIKQCVHLIFTKEDQLNMIDVDNSNSNMGHFLFNILLFNNLFNSLFIHQI